MSDYFEKSLPELLLDSQERINELEDKLRRYDAGITAYEWLLDAFPAKHSATLTPTDVQSMLCALTVFAETGRKTAAMERAMEEIS